jgi:hypothetical protein
MTYSLGSGGAARPKAFGSWRVTQGIWVLTQDLWELGPYAGHKVLGQVGLQDPRDLGLRSCHTQATWVRRPFPTPSFLGIDGDPWPKLIIIIIIIIIIILVVVVVVAATVIDFSLQINFMFFFSDSNDIYFKFNNFNEYNNIYNINNNIKLVWLKFL